MTSAINDWSFGSGRLFLTMFGLLMGVESGVTEVGLPATTNVVSVLGIVAGSALFFLFALV